MRSEQIVSEVELHHLAQHICGVKFHQLLNIVSYGGHDDALVGEFNAPCVDRLMAKKLIKVPNTGSTVMLLEGFECIAAAVSGEPNPPQNYLG